MRPKSHLNLKHSDIASIVDGPDLGEMVKIWRDVALSEARLNLLAKLREIKVGFNEVQRFGLGLKYCLKSEKMQDRGNKPILGVVRAAMDVKFRDETFLVMEKKRKREDWKRRLGRKHHPKTDKYKKEDFFSIQIH